MRRGLHHCARTYSLMPASPCSTQAHALHARPGLGLKHSAPGRKLCHLHPVAQRKKGGMGRMCIKDACAQSTRS